MLRNPIFWFVALCAGVWVVCAIHPHDRQTWLLEQIATALAIATLAGIRGVRWSVTSLGGLALLFVVHTVGTHYTYSLTPYDAWLQAATGLSAADLFGWERNHYDRFVHFLWGLCITLPAYEFLRQRLGLTRVAASHVSLHIVLSTSAIYELLEWSAAVVFGEGGTAYLGTQGDPWDAQADIAISIAGWTVCTAVHLAAHTWRKRSPDH